MAFRSVLSVALCIFFRATSTHFDVEEVEALLGEDVDMGRNYQISRALNSGCMAQGFYYANYGQLPLAASGPQECQALCSDSIECFHFSFWPDGGCHLAPKDVMLHNGNQECEEKFATGGPGHAECAGRLVIAGSRQCGSAFKDLYPMSSPTASEQVLQAVRNEVDEKRVEVQIEQAEAKEMADLEELEVQDDDRLKIQEAVIKAYGEQNEQKPHVSHYLGNMVNAIAERQDVLWIIWGVVSIVLVGSLIVLLYTAGYICGDAAERLNPLKRASHSTAFRTLPQDEDIEAGVRFV